MKAVWSNNEEHYPRTTERKHDNEETGTSLIKEKGITKEVERSRATGSNDYLQV